MPPVGFESTISAGDRPQAYALDCAATGTGSWHYVLHFICLSINVQGGTKAISTESSKLIEITDNMITRIGSIHSVFYIGTLPKSSRNIVSKYVILYVNSN